MAAESIPPCRTLYIRNLPEKLPKARLRELLHAAASPYGRIAWISASKTLQLRGQAFVTFADVASATAALRALQGSLFLGREAAVSYARAVSDRAASDAPAARERRKRARETAAAAAAAAAAAKEGAAAAPDQDADMEMADGDDGAAAVARAGGDAGANGAAPSAGTAVPALAPAPAVPNKILFAESLPESATSSGAAELTALFGRFAGFEEVRTVPGKRTIAFVEFASEDDAAVALSGLNAYKLGDPPTSIVLSYAKK